LPTETGCHAAGVAGNVANGDTVCVSSSIDAWLDLTIESTDTSGAFFGNQTFPQTLMLIDYHATLSQNGECIADTNEPNLGCLTPSDSAYTGFLQLVLDLGVDINGNSSSDVLKLDFVQLLLGDVTDTSQQGTNVYKTFNATIPGSGAVMDSITDPPFTFTLTGPTTAQQGIVYPAQIQEPAILSLMGLGLAGLGWNSRRKAVA